MADETSSSPHSAADAPAPAAPVPAQAAPPPAPATEAGGDEPSFDDVLEGLGTLNGDAIEALERGDTHALRAAMRLEAVPGNSAKPGAKEAARERNAQTGEQPGEAPNRISIKALKPEDRARTVQALDLIRGGHAPADAFAKVFGISALPAVVSEAVEHVAGNSPAPPAADQDQATRSIPELEMYLTDLQRQYQEARESYDPAATDILGQMQDVKLDLRDARQAAEAEARLFHQALDANHKRTLDKYSEIITEEPSFIPLCDHEIGLAETQNDPILYQPDWPEKIGQRVMDKYFKNAKVAQSPQRREEESAAQIPPAPRHSLRLPGSPVGLGFAAGSLSPQVAGAEIDKLTDEQQDALVRELDRITAPPKRR